jgi:H+/Cl- antiporter ClcA/CBS domain-containing protein
MSASPITDVLLPRQSSFSHVSAALTQFSGRFQVTPETTVLLLAVVIGSSTGIGIVIFRSLIESIHTWVLVDFMATVMPWGAWTLALAPTLGGVLVGLMRWCWKDFGPGITTLVTNSKGSQDLSPLRPLVKMLAAAVSLGTGASLGPEGPSVEIGAYFGSILGQVLQVSQERQRLLLGAGAAAGLAAGFNAPIAGVFLALEVVLGSTFVTSAVSVILLAAVLASFVSQLGLGGKPAFTLPVYEVRSLWELPLYLGLGFLACLVSIAFSRAIQLIQQGFRGDIPALDWMRQIPVALRPVLGGACVGIVALQLPQVMGVGYETVESMLQGVAFPVPLLVSLLVAKLAMTALSLGSGLVGGVFAPALFLGASLGATYGKILAWLIPGAATYIAAPPAYAMVGMAAVLAGTARAPLTAILLLFELTRDYRIVLPLMAAVGLSTWLVDRFKPVIDQSSPQSLQKLGLSLEQTLDPEILKRSTVREAMERSPLLLSQHLSGLEAGKVLMSHKVHTGLVIDLDEHLVGIITLNDIGRSMTTVGANSLLELKVSDLCTQAVLLAYEDEPLSEAVSRMATRGLHQLPVVDRESSCQVLGLLTKEGIDLVCSTAVAREALQQFLTSQPSPKVVEPLAIPVVQQAA